MGKPCSRTTSGKGAGDQIASRMPSWNLPNETAGKRVCLVARVTETSTATRPYRPVSSSIYRTLGPHYSYRILHLYIHIYVHLILTIQFVLFFCSVFVWLFCSQGNKSSQEQLRIGRNGHRYRLNSDPFHFICKYLVYRSTG